MQPSSLDPMRHVPSLIVVGDLHSRCIYSNNYTAHLFGYSSAHSLLGATPYELRCKAVENAEKFVIQNQHVIEKENVLTLLDVHEYANTQSKVLVTKKSPYWQEDAVAGSVCYCIEVNSKRLNQLCYMLIETDKKYQTNKISKERSYIIGHPAIDEDLTPEETEWVFYFLRSKTMRSKDKLKTIMAKLDCSTKSELIEYAKSKGYLDYIPSGVFVI